MKNFNYISEIIVSNGKSNTAVYFKNESKIVVNDDYNEIDNKYGLDCRFINCLKAKNDKVIIIDDDLNISQDELYKVILKYQENPNKIVGIFGRNITKNNEYDWNDRYDDVDIILTRLLIVDKKICSLFFICKPLIEHIYKNGKPYGNGEDIFLSFIANIYYGNKNLCLKNVKSNDFPQNNSISGNKNHLVYRKLLTKYLYNNRKMFEILIKNLKI
jgi:hypothetical protein